MTTLCRKRKLRMTDFELQPPMKRTKLNKEAIYKVLSAKEISVECIINNVIESSCVKSSPCKSKHYVCITAGLNYDDAAPSTDHHREYHDDDDSKALQAADDIDGNGKERRFATNATNPKGTFLTSSAASFVGNTESKNGCGFLGWLNWIENDETY
eukprot:CAMPEP_0197036656 /NCGR_PEP_ID=MMETSP1384-20130603/14101_1 /TAXON_ID=29189 /ORGANISM="Ammonia sp." /LENGTH=155 /DNA_ID=CAMNT_0042466855 /DNA_START=42 /DNA_END=509 /DNA_ORIENTATION=+